MIHLFPGIGLVSAKSFNERLNDASLIRVAGFIGPGAARCGGAARQGLARSGVEAPRRLVRAYLARFISAGLSPVEDVGASWLTDRQKPPRLAGKIHAGIVQRRSHPAAERRCTENAAPIPAQPGN